MTATNTDPVIRRVAGRLDVRIYSDRAESGAAAARAAAAALRTALATRDEARVVFAAAPSQRETLAGLRAAEGIDWSKVVVFHMDEYIGLPADAPQRFGRFLHHELWNAVRPGAVHVIDPGDDPEAESARYAGLLGRGPIDLVCLGIGDNGHLAFNDPPVADFADPLAVKVVELDDACRRQQVSDGCFATLADVPERAITLTVPTLMAGRTLVATVPGVNKRAALAAALDGPVAESCPASVLRTHPDCTLFADLEAHP
ncbi:glucosamine-6-phosphate deaminase [Nonomuraea sp. K274]|uniref:Glucosamine-6-phosphate deaminase n=1 Tax=Nonomuraea cypriaca TaxID=1187855 RepID=A0A931A3E0_9ACTN|nr:glucosamine-6-phosphate deaminase [Nonomuraea cypriaca]MBF8184348.1 glucosamine-6-phosphate deaminase [Nonomuraea cypriaca]